LLKSKLLALLEKRYYLSTQLYSGIGGAVFPTVAATLVAWFALNSVGSAQSQVTERSVPELVAAFGVSQHSATLVAAAPRLTAATTQEELADVVEEIDTTYQSLEGQMSVLGIETRGRQSDIGSTRQAVDLPVATVRAVITGGDDTSLDADELRERTERANRVRGYVDSLILTIDDVEAETSRLFQVSAQREALRTELTTLRDELENIVGPAVDDQLFYTMTGYRDLESVPPPREEYFSENEIERYRHMAELQSDARNATLLLESAFAASDAPLVEPLRERFEAARGRIERNLSALEGSSLYASIDPVLDRLFALGVGDNDVFDLIEQELRIIQVQQDLLDRNRDVALDLVVEVNELVSSARASAADATGASNQAILTGRTLLVAISAVSIGGAVLIAWLFVGRVLLRRLQLLSDWMRRMANGDLKASVDVGGRDEVADMAAALEVFRRNSLEAQRLNLVEKLAEELQGKNEQLESVLAELQTAQDQIVMREKLAALGELTAGVAHEIRNPLNFIKNFSEVSEELLEELKEALEEVGENMTEDQRGLIQDVSSDLTENLERIRSHGDRANRIVHDMLMMGRGSSERQSVDINRLLDEYSGLAYHSARAVDSEFQLDLRKDLDPEAPQIEVVPQELGRVFLNMVGNACDATDEKRRAAQEAGDGAEPYVPTLWLITRRGQDSIEVRIKDNGNGIPPDIIDSVFNPFFTTKPTGQGTGLGLAMSSDIVREHGGTIRVESELGNSTEMIIDLPLTPPAIPMDSESE